MSITKLNTGCRVHSEWKRSFHIGLLWVNLWCGQTGVRSPKFLGCMDNPNFLTHCSLYITPFAKVFEVFFAVLLLFSFCFSFLFFSKVTLPPRLLPFTFSLQKVFTPGEPISRFNGEGCRLLTRFVSFRCRWDSQCVVGTAYSGYPCLPAVCC